MRRRFSLVIAILAGLTRIASAAEGRIPLLSLPGPPYLITQPGYYLLTSSIGPTAGLAVAIQSDGVTLDLGGHLIQGPTDLSAPVISISVISGFKGVTVKNGRILMGSTGISGFGSPQIRVRFEGLDIAGSLKGISLGAEHAEVLGCRVHHLAIPGGAASAAIEITASTGRVLDNEVHSVPGSGIDLWGFRTGEVRHNDVRNFGLLANTGFGISFENRNQAPFISGGAVIADNMVTSLPAGMDDDGIRIIGSNNAIIGNVAARNGGVGLSVLGSENRIERNLAGGNGGDGIVLGAQEARNHLDANQSQGNRGCGLNLNAGAGVILRDNTVGGNAGGNICGGPGVNAGGNYCDLAPCP